MENKIDGYKIFESVARNESISKASEELYISQPAVSQSIKKLEDSLGGPLFYRTKFGVRLTNEGKEFYNQVKQGLDFIENGERIFSSLKNIETGTIKIGASTTLTKYILIPYLKEFHKRFPSIKIDIVNNLSSSLIKTLKSGLIDLLILNTPIQDQSDLNITPIETIEDVFCANKEYIDTSKTYTFDELKNYNLIIQKKPSNTRLHFDTLLKENNQTLTPFIEAASFTSVAELTKICFGYSYLPKQFIKKELNEGSLALLKTNINTGSRDVVLITSKNNSLSFATNELIKLITSK
jgi:DNA-binding transcriptional LysR family regulator